MKKIAILFFFIVGCTTFKPPNSDICVKDSPSHFHCAWTISGPDFDIDNNSHLYTLHSQKLTADQYDKLSLHMSPWTYADQKKQFLSYCHAHKSACNYPLAVKTFADIESRLGIDRMLNDSILQMLENENHLEIDRD